MKYLLLICLDPSIEVSQEDEAKAGRWVAEMEGRGARVIGSKVGPARDATSIRVRDDELQLTDGPFAETKEQMAGFDLIDCADLDEAVEFVSKHPVARLGTIELRPLTEDCR